jgi:hypothetical protein
LLLLLLVALQHALDLNVPEDACLLRNINLAQQILLLLLLCCSGGGACCRYCC